MQCQICGNNYEPKTIEEQNVGACQECANDPKMRYAFEGLIAWSDGILSKGESINFDVGVAAASSEQSGYEKEKAFDNDLNTQWKG